MSYNAQQRYSSLTIALHWFMLVLIAAVYICMEFRDIFPKGSDARDAMKMWHFMLGLSVLGLMVVRIAARLSGGTPEILPVQPKAVLLMAKLMHLSLYLFMIAMPLIGWLILSAEGKPVPFFGLELPPLVGVDKHLAHQAEEAHELGATLGYWLIGLHAAAGIFHHHVKKDNTLTRMLPKFRK